MTAQARGALDWFHGLIFHESQSDCGDCVDAKPIGEQGSLRCVFPTSFQRQPMPIAPSHDEEKRQLSTEEVNLLNSKFKEATEANKKMIDALCKVGKTDEAYKPMLMMEEKGCYPNVVTYTAMIDGFGKAGNVEKCLELFKQMSSKGCAPSFITYRVLINHCCSTGLLDEAHKLLDEMKQTHWPTHMAGYRKVIEG
ncbi:pentatricopeptide repeat-containing protein [Pyrus ussuriensis x Pyrus communis]|uniref:Pentatricopeptide repeat-containing protein n=1 Tax=Pyrus ussuriensis x Pyrus communis TaxID=2448454 RepID=A0A5N5H8U7_9ROSA|nr:pentatricopeptide repeat-containing protein [Pyrus ussuriensis x Pyrus communis]